MIGANGIDEGTFYCFTQRFAVRSCLDGGVALDGGAVLSIIGIGEEQMGNAGLCRNFLLFYRTLMEE